MHAISRLRPVGRAEPLPTAEGIDDATLVARALDGDRWAKEALYRRHVRRVTNAVTRMVGRSAEADDAIQEAFLIAFTRLPELRDPGAFRGWLAQIAVNEVRGRLRRRRWKKRLGLDREEDDASLEALAALDASPEVRAELARLDVLLSSLDAELRMAWMLRYVEGWELTEVATALDCSLATAKRRIKEAKDRIDAHVAGRRP
ncbi:MAG: RNA polymerase sigma factor [Myxococcales bacterium]|nr:RNA polymerase sigma factor [Myxococcales bacterium]